MQDWMAREPEAVFLMTTTAAASARLWERRIKTTPTYQKRLVHQMLPFDHPWLMRRFVYHWKPRISVLSEGDLWPAMQDVLQKCRVPRFLLAGRLTKKEWQRWRPFRRLFAWMVRSMTVAVPSSEQAALLGALGAVEPRVLPGLKWWVPENRLHATLKKKSDAFQVVCGASTHEGEEAILVGAFLTLRDRHSDLKLVLAPRDLGRLPRLKKMLKKAHLSWQLWSEIGAISRSAPVTLIDRMGCMNEVYGASHVVVMGFSFFPKGEGHNLIEPAWNGCALLHGPFMSKQTDVVRTLQACDAAHTVTSDTITPLLHALLQDKKLLEERGQKAHLCATEQRAQAQEAYRACLSFKDAAA